jgi:hypothetical protein
MLAVFRAADFMFHCYTLKTSDHPRVPSHRARVIRSDAASLAFLAGLTMASSAAVPSDLFDPAAARWRNLWLIGKLQGVATPYVQIWHPRASE